MKQIKIYACVLIMMISTLFSAAALENNSTSGGVDRYAVFVGANNGGKNHQKLLYAASDAVAFQKTMTSIGGVSDSNGILLLDPSKSDLDDALSLVSRMIEKNKASAKRSEFIFYYSGHSDETSLLLGKTKYDYSNLKAAISAVPSDVHVVILDSCYSGNFIRTKGGQKKKSFLFDDSSVVKGHAYLSSSSSQEFSQESDEIGSSFFTNAMLTGLRGAADSSGDKKVTLNELYSYAFNETLSKTEKTSAGPQHPNFNITLVGSGDLVLSDISSSDCVVMLPSSLSARVIIRNSAGQLVSEVNKFEGNPVYLALDRGEYKVTVIGEKQTLDGRFTLNPGSVYELSESSLGTVKITSNRIRGNEAEDLPSEKVDINDELPGEDSGEKTGENPARDSATENEGEMFVPFEFSFVSNEFSRQYDKKINTNFSLAVLRSHVHNVTGGMVSGAGNEADNVEGIQAAYVYNVTEEKVKGVQAAGIFNLSKKLEGLQSAGIFNVNEGFRGAQFAGIFNAASEFEGIQAAGIFNAGGKFKGLQASGILNASKGFSGAQLAGIINGTLDFKGLQAAGIVNVAESFTGLQAAAITNVSKKVEKGGVQLGLINIADECYGWQIGLINFSRTGVFEFGTSLTSNENLRFSFNSGNRYFYTALAFSAPADYFDGEQIKEGIINVAGGFGTRFEIKKFNFDFEILASSYIKGKETENSTEEDKDIDVEFCMAPAVHLCAGFTPVKHLNIFAGVILSTPLDADSKNENKNYNYDLIKETKQNCVLKDGKDSLYVEFEAGIKVKI